MICSITVLIAEKVFNDFENFLTSSMEIRPPEPEPWTWAISMPISRANNRTEGAAATFVRMGVTEVAAGGVCVMEGAAFGVSAFCGLDGDVISVGGEIGTIGKLRTGRFAVEGMTAGQVGKEMLR